MEIQPGYIEQKERWGSLKFDDVIVFGQGPVRPVRLVGELTRRQLETWLLFTQDPLHRSEPDFYLMDSQEALNQFNGLGNDEKEKKRWEWQHTGRFALNKLGRLNALAAGLSLYLGVTDRIIFTGGKTRSEGLKIDENTWPSEAELMTQVSVARFGKLYAEKFGKPITLAIDSEDKATNTLTNYGYTIKKHPELLNPQRRVGLLATDHHVRRVAILSHLFSLWEAPRGQISAQELLRERALIRGKAGYENLLKHFRDALNNPSLRNNLYGEERFERGLIDPDYLAYWLGFIADAGNPQILRNIILSLNNSDWVEAARQVFEEVGINFDMLTRIDLIQLAEKDPERFQVLLNSLLPLQGKKRVMPPPIKVNKI